MGTPRPRRLNALTSMRFIAAGSIIAMHCRGHYGLPVDMTCGGRLPLYLGVSFFFVLSGFILTYVYPRLESRSAFRRFLWARIARIWPCHVFAFAVMIVPIMADGMSPSILWRGGRALPSLANLSLVHSWVPLQSFYHAPNMPSWSVATEFGFYLAFPLLLWRLDRNWPVKVAGCLMLGVVLIGYCQRAAIPYEGARGPTTTGLLYMHPFARLLEFCVGMVAASFWRRFSPRLQFGRVMGTVVELATIGTLATNIYFWPEIATWIVSTTGADPTTSVVWLSQNVTCLGFAALIFVAALERGWITRALSWRGLVFLGEISYAAYLLHWPLLSVFYQFETSLARYPSWAVIAVYVTSVLAAATGCWYFVEAPARRFLMGLLPERGSIPVPHYALGSRVDLLGGQGSRGDRRKSPFASQTNGRVSRHN